MADGLTIRNVTKYYGDFQALNNINLEIPEGQFVTLLGPSGCGKTTLLRIIAGFLECESGEIYFGDQLMNDIPPNKRDTAMCFQSYALFPNKSVYENIRFGLRMRKVPEAEHPKRVKEAMEMVNLQGLENRMPYELSGGQQQRVSLARCIVVRPKLLLFDEPLSNLDAKLREKVRVEIRAIQKQLGITTIYVTHDQAEALAISDRIVAMSNGHIVQSAPPREVYDRPNCKYVADFIGTANIVPCTVVSRDGSAMLVRSVYGDLQAIDPDCNLEVGAGGFLCIRPEDLHPVKERGSNVNYIKGTVQNAVYMGNLLDMFVSVADAQIRTSVSKDWEIRAGSQITFTVEPSSIRVLEE